MFSLVSLKSHCADLFSKVAASAGEGVGKEEVDIAGGRGSQSCHRDEYESSKPAVSGT